MAARNRLPPWHEMVRVADGRELLIRPIRPDDAVPLRAGFALMEPGALRHRFDEAMSANDADADVPLSELLREAFPFLLVMVGALALVTVWPGIVLFLPRLAGYAG